MSQQDYESFRQRLKTWLSPDTGVFSALETFVIIALYNSTFKIPYHVINPDPVKFRKLLKSLYFSQAFNIC